MENFVDMCWYLLIYVDLGSREYVKFLKRYIEQTIKSGGTVKNRF
jgi:hypothetical protein